MITPDHLAAIEARATAASKGPWDAARGANSDGTTYATSKAQKAEFLALSLNDDTSPLWLIVSDEVIPAAPGDGPRARANAEFIAHARTDVPALLALVRKQQAALDALVYVAENKADLTKPVGQWWSEVIKGTIKLHMGLAMSKPLKDKLARLFYLAQAEVEDAAKLQPGDYLVHTNDVQEVLNTLQKRTLEDLA